MIVSSASAIHVAPVPAVCRFVVAEGLRDDGRERFVAGDARRDDRLGAEHLRLGTHGHLRDRAAHVVERAPPVHDALASDWPFAHVDPAFASRHRLRREGSSSAAPCRRSVPGHGVRPAPAADVFGPAGPQGGSATRAMAGRVRIGIGRISRERAGYQIGRATLEEARTSARVDAVEVAGIMTEIDAKIFGRRPLDGLRGRNKSPSVEADRLDGRRHCGGVLRTHVALWRMW